MALHQSGELKKRAWLAKQRLKMGYWESVKTESKGDGPSDVSAPRMNAKLRLEVSSHNAAEESMYQKVCAILDRDETTINPIGQLIDGEVYSKLDPASKQRYVLELSNKFRELKERYYREHTGA